MEKRRRREADDARDRLAVHDGICPDEHVAERSRERGPVRLGEEVERRGISSAHGVLVEGHECVEADRAFLDRHPDPGAARSADDASVMSLEALDDLASITLNARDLLRQKAAVYAPVSPLPELLSPMFPWPSRPQSGMQNPVRALRGMTLRRNGNSWQERLLCAS